MWRFLPGLIFLLLTALLLYAVSTEPPENLLRADLTGEPAPALQAAPLATDATMPQPRLLAVTSGTPVLVNFFASWCTPCEAEHPQLMALKERYGVAVIGIAWNDKPEDTRAWLERLGDPFAFSGTDEAGRTAVAYGVQGVPESFLLDGEGRILHHIAGPITPDALERGLAPLLTRP